MFSCLLCGLDNPSPNARFCTQCGPSANWPREEVDLPHQVAKYWVSVRDLMLEPDHDEVSFQDLSTGLRIRLKISFATHNDLMQAIVAQRARAQALSRFSFEFDENVFDSIAGQDTQLRFRLSNNSETDLLKISISWDDPETPSPVDFAIKGTRFLKPGEKLVVSGTYVFPRSGPKDIVDMRLTVSDPYHETATFSVVPFSFKVGAGPQPVGLAQDTAPRWKILRRTLVLDDAMPSTVVPAIMPAGLGPVPLPVSVAPAAASRAETDELTQRAHHFVQALEAMTRMLPAAEQGRLFTNAFIPLNWLEGLTTITGEDGPEDVLGLTLEDVSQAVRDAEGALSNDFHCAATCVTRGGLAVYHGDEPSGANGSWTLYQWNQLWPNGLKFFKQRFGPTAFIVSFGSEASRSALPGLRFDLRRYQGPESVDACIERASQCLDDICAIAPIPDDLTPGSWGGSDEDQLDDAPEIEYDGIHYRGQAVDGVPHGHGVLIYDNGDQLKGTFDNGEINGEATYTYASGTVLVGPHRQNVAHGLCKVTQPDGSEEECLFSEGDYLASGPFGKLGKTVSYVGQIRDGKGNGYGMARFPDGTFYIGEIKDDHRWGIGWEEDASGVYVGSFIKGFRHGDGMLTDKNGDTYQVLMSHDEVLSREPYETVRHEDGSSYTGGLDDGVRQGLGVYRYANGDMYVGEWDGGIKSGHGVYYWTSGACVVSEFLLDTATGAGTYIDAEGRETEGLLHKYELVFPAALDSLEFRELDNGARYRGEMQNGQYHGFGLYIFADDNYYLGQFANGKRHGHGSYFWTDLDSPWSEMGGQFVNDNLQGQGKQVGQGSNAGHTYEGEMTTNPATGNWDRHGRGVYRFPDGRVLDGYWNFGEFTDNTPPGAGGGQSKSQGLWGSFKEGFKKGYDSTSKE